MSSKNKGFIAGLADSFEPEKPPEAPVSASDAGRLNRVGMNALMERSNRISELASGSLVTRSMELVDPARCRIWSEHNRNYATLNEANCADLINSIKAKGRQEFPAIVRRVKGESGIDFEVIAGARRHWAISWLRAHNYPEFRYLVEPRDLTDEEAFRLADLENRARSDLTDIERARDYLRALERYYGGKQKAMAERLDASESWLSRYLDLARLPDVLMAAFPDPADLRIKHVTQLKPLLKPKDRRERVLAEAQRLAEARSQGLEGSNAPVAKIIRALAAAADAPKRSGSPKRSGRAASEVYGPTPDKPVLRVEARGKKEIGLTLMLKPGVSRTDVEAAFAAMLERYWGANEPAA